MNFRRLAVVVFALLAMLFVGHQPAFAQGTAGTGSITGVVTDPQGAAVPGARVTITNKDTGLSFDLSTNSSGVYNSGNVVPGNYLIKVQSPNFKTTQVSAVVQIGQIASTNIKLELGASTTVVEVTAETTHVACPCSRDGARRTTFSNSARAVLKSLRERAATPA